MCISCRQALRTAYPSSAKLHTLVEASKLERRSKLRKKIHRFRDMQAIHMPTLRQHIAVADDTTNYNPEDVTLYLPSHLPSDLRSKICDSNLLFAEEELREAEAYESLEDLRRHLRSRMFANKYKIKNITGQRANTRARTWQKTIDDRAISAKHRYCRARSALFQLRGCGDWEDVLRVLNDEDVRALNERALSTQEKADWESARHASGIVEEELQGVVLQDHETLGEGRRTLSWIWFSVRSGEFDKDTGMHDGMFHVVYGRMSYCKSLTWYGQHCAWNGQSPKLVQLAGKRKSCC